MDGELRCINRSIICIKCKICICMQEAWNIVKQQINEQRGQDASLKNPCKARIKKMAEIMLLLKT